MLKLNKMIKMMGIGFYCLFLLGCTKENFFVLKEDSSTVVLEDVIAMEEAQESVEDEKREEQKENNDTQEEKTEIDHSVQEREIAVHICGAVKEPGVYYFKEKQRVYEGILKAGGFREDAAEDYLNQALFLEDGMKIVVPTKDEIQNLENSVQTGGENCFIQGNDTLLKSETKGQKVDLNTADEALLCTLPGIGESRAKSILAYRREYGKFQKIEDIMKVSGIKEAAYEKIKDYVTVSP